MEVKGLRKKLVENIKKKEFKNISITSSMMIFFLGSILEDINGK